MKTIIEIIKNYCKNYGSYISIAKLQEIWTNRNPLRSAEFRALLQALMCAGDIRMEFDRVYLDNVWRQENYAAEKLHEMLYIPSSESVDLPDHVHVGDIELTDEQRDAVAACLSNRLILLLAPAGCGKTTVAQAILQHSGAVNPMLCSPTGKAAKILSARTNRPAGTVHRALGVRKIEDFSDVQTMEDVDLIIVDEATMLTVDMLAGILRAADENCRIVLLGDRNQLPAVGPGDVINDLVELRFTCVNLTANHRLAAGNSALKDAVLGYDDILYPWQLKTDDSLRKILSEDESALMDKLAKEAAARYRRGESVQVLSLLNVDVLEINRRIQRIVNPARAGQATLHTIQFDYRDNDRVIIIENDYQQMCFNGEVGTLRLGSDGTYSVELEDGRTPTWSEMEAPTKLMPAYAITVHRAQGSEYDSVLMYLPRCSGCLLHRNSFYTGISRARKQLMLYANPAALNFALYNPPPKRNSALVEKVAVQERLLAG